MTNNYGPSPISNAIPAFRSNMHAQRHSLEFLRDTTKRYDPESRSIIVIVRGEEIRVSERMTVSGIVDENHRVGRIVDIIKKEPRTLDDSKLWC